MIEGANSKLDFCKNSDVLKGSHFSVLFQGRSYVPFASSRDTPLSTDSSSFLPVARLRARRSDKGRHRNELLCRHRPEKTERKTVRTGKMVAYFRPDEATDRLAREILDYI